MKKIGVLLVVVLSVLYACTTDEGEISCSSTVDTPLLNLSFFSRDSSELSALTLDTLIIKSSLTTLLDTVSVNKVGVNINPQTVTIDYLFTYDSTTAVSETLTVNYSVSTQLISRECGFSTSFSIQSASATTDSVVVVSSTVSNLSDEEHIYIFH